ncbi:MAG TPA: metal ABC transporter permease [Beijerinckiaceae bacterium]|nr:metal ABC transporter permease [Beijerinckiaceae bacterium]
MEGIASLLAPFAEFGFMRRALAGCVALSVSAPLIGVFLMLRRMSLVGDAIQHAILPGAALGYLVAGLSLGAMTLGGLVAGLAVALLAGLITRTTNLREDTAIATFYILSLALGVTLLTARGTNVDVLRVLFGSVLALDDATLLLMTGVSSITVLALALFLRPMVLEFADSGFLRSVSAAGGAMHFLFLGLAVLNMVAAFHALGTLLSIGIMILPAATARLWTNDLTRLMASSVAIALASCSVGLVASYHLELASGPAIILVAGCVYMASILAGRAGGLLPRLIPRRHLEG